jgi:L-aspartate oxidase
MWLDARHLGDRAASQASVSRFWERRFPTILSTCRSYGVDPVTQLIPIAPACHYASGGVATDLWGRTSVPGLYATGEVACSGVHGANRLASNSLLEGLVFSRRISDVLPDDLAGGLGGLATPAPDRRTPGLLAGDLRDGLEQLMTDRVGVLRSAGGLAEAATVLEELAVSRTTDDVDQAAWEATNLLTISTAMCRAATLREETRGSHWRDDFPERDDRHYAGHFDARMVDGRISVEFSPAPQTDPSMAGVP